MLVSGQLIETCLLAPSGVETGTPSGSLNSLAGLIPISLPPVYYTFFFFVPRNKELAARGLFILCIYKRVLAGGEP